MRSLCVSVLTAGLWARRCCFNGKIGRELICVEYGIGVWMKSSGAKDLKRGERPGRYRSNTETLLYGEYALIDRWNNRNIFSISQKKRMLLHHVSLTQSQSQRFSSSPMALHDIKLILQKDMGPARFERASLAAHFRARPQLA